MRTPVKLPGPSETTMRSARPLSGQFGNHRHQPFGMAAAEDLASPCDQSAVFEQGCRAGLGRAVYAKHAPPHAARQSMRLKVSNSGRGLRAKMLSGSP